MRIIIELDNVAPVTLKVSPTEGDQMSTAPEAANVEEAINAGSAPSDDSDQSNDQVTSDLAIASDNETSAGSAPVF